MKTYDLLCQVDDGEGRLSSREDYDSYEEAAGLLRGLFLSAMRSAHTSVEISIHELDGEERRGIDWLAAYGYRPEDDQYFDEPPVPVGDDEIIILGEDAFGGVRYGRSTDGDWRDQAAAMVRDIYRDGDWRDGARVMVYADVDRVIWVWDAEGYA